MVVTITPELAEEWLELNIADNRLVRKTTVEKYALYMRSGEWLMTGQPIIFNNGCLIDGQHRLHACIKASTSFQSLVVWNVDANAFEYLDHGLRRNMADALRSRNHANVNTLAAIVRLVVTYERGFTQTFMVERHVTQQDLLSEIEANIETYSMAASVGWRAGDNGFNQSGAGAAYVLLTKQFGHESCEAFMNPAIDGVGLHSNDPRLSLRRFAIKSRANNLGQLVAWIKAWNAYSSGKSLQKIYTLQPRQHLPRITAPRKEPAA
jgi:hypothetical protein